MESLGKYLLDLRQERGIGYRKIDDELHFPEWKIRKLEENKLEEIGEMGIVKSLLFNYARYLEADVDMVMEEFRRIYAGQAPPKPEYYTIPKEKKIMLSTNFLWTVAIIIFVLILGSIVFYAGSRGFLKAPQIFSKERPDSTKSVAQKAQTPDEPDTLRARMRLLTESMKPEAQEAEQKPEKKSKNSRTVIPADTTDHMGRLLGDNPGNVSIH